MRFHVVALPHTQITPDFATCAYTEKTRKFCRMMIDRGHDVFLYAGETSVAPCTEHIVCISENYRASVVNALPHFTQMPFDPSLPLWRAFNSNAIRGIRERVQQQDFICLIGGLAQRAIADAFPLPQHLCVEYGIGYGGSFLDFRVFESYAWMHHIYGIENQEAGRNRHAADGKWFDQVIPGYLEPELFPVVTKKQDYLLFVGRMIERKGIHIAVQVAEATGRKLIMAGPGDPPQHPLVEYAGEVGPVERGTLMGNAHALLTPSIYLEPFGNVVVEAQACGTPTITTDWGAFPETNPNGVTGFRCHVLRDFVFAVNSVSLLDTQAIADRARALYGIDHIGSEYEKYFDRLSLLWKSGWPEMD